MTTGLRRNALLLGSVLFFAFSACSSKPPASDTPAAKPKAAGATKVDTNSPTDSSSVTKSVFTANPKDGRDPFFPSRKAMASTTTGTDAKTEPQAKSDLSAFLNFQGIVFGQAFVNDTPIASGRNYEIPIVVNGAQQKVKIRCLKITKNSVEISMEGHPGTIVLRSNKL